MDEHKGGAREGSHGTIIARQRYEDTVMAAAATVLRHPLLWFTLGAAAGYYSYRYRKEIAAAVAKGADMDGDFAPQQHEGLSELPNEAEGAEEAAGESAGG